MEVSLIFVQFWGGDKDSDLHLFDELRTALHDSALPSRDTPMPQMSTANILWPPHSPQTPLRNPTTSTPNRTPNRIQLQSAATCCDFNIITRPKIWI